MTGRAGSAVVALRLFREGATSVMTPDDLRTRFPSLTDHVSTEDCLALLGTLVPITLEPGAELVRHGDHADTMCLVEDGLLSIHVEEGGERLILGQAGPGSVVGEVGMIAPGPASATVVAVERTSLLSLGHEAFEEFGEEHPGAASALLKAVSSELVHRLRFSGGDLVKRIDDHEWMRSEARKDRVSWYRRLAHLVGGSEEAS